MNTHDFNIWLATHRYTQRQLAKALDITEATITTYKRNDRFPVIFQLALKGLVA